jgi:hypothetical protein
VAKQTAGQLAKQLGKQALIGAGTGAATGLATGGGLRGALTGAAQGAVPSGGAGVSGGLRQGLTQVGKQTAVNVGSNLAARKLGGAGGGAVGTGIQAALGRVPGLQSGQPQGGNVYSNFMPGGPGQPSGGGRPGQAPNWRDLIGRAAGGAVQGASGGGGWKGALSGAAQGATGQAGPGTYPPIMNAAPGGGGMNAAGAGGAGGGGGAAGGGTGGGQQGFWGKWGPVIAEGGGMVAGGLAARQAQRSAMQRSPEEAQSLAGGFGTADQARKMAMDAYGESKPYLRQAGGYYSSLLSGNRAAMQQAVAPTIAQLTGQYRGAQRGVEGSLRGAARDYALGGLARQKASDVAGVTTGVQPGAADALSRLGLQGMQFGAPLLGVAGNIYSNFLPQGQANRQWAAGEGRRTGEAIGDFIGHVGDVAFGNRGQQPQQQRLPSRTTTSSGGPLGPSGTTLPPGGQDMWSRGMGPARSPYQMNAY